MSYTYKILVLFFLLHLQLLAVGQQDTIQLKEIQITTPAQRGIYTHGYKIINLDSSSSLLQSQSLSYILSLQPSLFIKSYGNGMLSTLSIRGSSSTHTALLWNGININLPTVGQTDFSLIALSTADHISITYGGSSALIGSDGIGGSINISSPIPKEWNKSTELNIGQSIGSFKNLYSYLHFSSIRKKTNHSIKAYRSYCENQFPFKNITKPGSPIEKQQNADFYQYGYTEDFHFKITNRQLISIHAWATYMNRAIQPSMFNNTITNEKQEDTNIRGLLSYQYESSIGYLTCKMAYLYDWITYSNPLIGRFIYQTHRLTGTAEQDIKKFKKTAFKIGGIFNHVKGIADEYSKSITELRYDIYLSTEYKPSERLQLSMTLRQPFVNNSSLPLIPSIGADYCLFQKYNYSLHSKSTLSKSYRLPTLNERYWTPGGNPDIKPEESIGYETGFTIQKSSSMIEHQVELSHYNYTIKNWILWIPYAFYFKSENIEKVQNYGFEFLYNLSYNLKNIKLQSNASYSYTRTFYIEQNNEKKQLPYIPFHSGTIHHSISYKQTKLHINCSFSGYRNISTHSKLTPIQLIDLGVEKKINLKKEWHLYLSFYIKNILNKTYQPYEYKSIPGINYNLHILFKIK
jgi:vitamin B12 transporter